MILNGDRIYPNRILSRTLDSISLLLHPAAVPTVHPNTFRNSYQFEPMVVDCHWQS